MFTLIVYISEFREYFLIINVILENTFSVANASVLKYSFYIILYFPERRNGFTVELRLLKH